MASEGTPAARLAAVTRRGFVKCVAVSGLVVSGMGSSSWAEEKAAKGTIYRTLGSTGQNVSAVGLGGFHIGNPRLESESGQDTAVGPRKVGSNTLVERPDTHDTRKKLHEINCYFRGGYIRIKRRP